ncbi:DinB family protein [Nocardiopsis trehalosi]|jgi:hypothetical protein|uniref:DinB family protein n=1 Tax=Nocardiopsis trehalosi TaxID=109329 RepID=UPI0008326226|nr:DinB family protein [Nocardiopsis trehalosi]
MTTSPIGDDEPPITLSAPRELLNAYLDHYRAVVLRKLDGMAEADLRTSRLPSGWTPLELVRHLAYVERRWFQWGFAAEPVPEPWGDSAPGTERWHVPDDASVGSVLDFYRAQCARSREVAAAADLGDRARVGGRFATPEDAPTLGWICFHVLQEYARHAGHLDVARELADGATGE